jgi:hypothetical protein
MGASIFLISTEAWSSGAFRRVSQSYLKRPLKKNGLLAHRLLLAPPPHIHLPACAFPSIFVQLDKCSGRRAKCRTITGQFSSLLDCSSRSYMRLLFCFLGGGFRLIRRPLALAWPGKENKK